MYCHPSRRPSTEHRKAGCSPIRFYSANTDCHHSHFTNITVKHWRVLTVTKRCPLTVKIIPIVIDSYFESTMNRKTTRSTLPSSVAQSRRRSSMCISNSWGGIGCHWFVSAAALIATILLSCLYSIDENDTSTHVQ